jgi:hypothetical protein
MPDIDPAVLEAVRQLQAASDDEDVKVRAAAVAAQQLQAAQAANSDAKSAQSDAHKAVLEKYDAATAALKAKYLGS